MNNIKISVIVPVFNVERYLRECIDSILCQTYKHIEVILVDDGSTDNSAEICDEYEQKDSRILVIHKKNEGLSEARNTGVRYATGQYGIFIDSDDFWSDIDGLRQIVSRANRTNADVLSFAYHKLEEDTARIVAVFHADESMPEDLENEMMQLDYLTSHSLYISSAWNKLIRMKLLQELPFEKGRVSEDVEWSAKLMDMACSFDYLNLDFYCYRQRKGSISQAISEKSCGDLKDAILGCISIFNRCDYRKKEYIGRYTAFQFATFIAVQAVAEVFPKDYIKMLENEKDILKFYGNNKKVKYIYIGTKLFGFNFFCKIIKITKPIWDPKRDRI